MKHANNIHIILIQHGDNIVEMFYLAVEKLLVDVDARLCTNAYQNGFRMRNFLRIILFFLSRTSYFKSHKKKLSIRGKLISDIIIL
jgi:hypothetical protein